MPADKPAEAATAPILHAADHPVNTVYSWERNGDFFSLYPGDDGRPPYDATEIFVRLYPFPEAAVREIYLNARSRTHHHVSREDILFYQVSGRRVQIVNERSCEVNAGDASIQISGVFKRVDQIIPGVFIEFSMLRPAKDGAEASWVLADQVPLRDVDGHQEKTFPLQGYELHEARLAKGQVFKGQHSDPTVFYMVSGEARVRIDGAAETVTKSDAMRATGGTPYEIAALEDTVFIYAHIPATRPQA